MPPRSAASLGERLAYLEARFDDLEPTVHAHHRDHEDRLRGIEMTGSLAVRHVETDLGALALRVLALEKHVEAEVGLEAGVRGTMSATQKVVLFAIAILGGVGVLIDLLSRIP